MNKKGQLSFEYVIVVGMFLVLAVPFFYTFTYAMTGELIEQANQDALIKVAEAVESLNELGSPTNRMSVPVRIGGRLLTANGEEGSTLSLDFPGASTNPSILVYGRVYGKLPARGFHIATVTNSLIPGSTVVGSEPTIVALCKKEFDLNTDLASPDCTHKPDQALQGVGPSDSIRVVGVNLRNDQGNAPLVGLFDTRDTDSVSCDNPQCTSNLDCPDNRVCMLDLCACSQYAGQVSDSPELIPGQEEYIVDVGASGTGAHTYLVSVAVPGMGQSDAWLVDYQLGGD